MTAAQTARKQSNIQRALLDVDDCVLVIIDAQPPFLDKLPREDSQLLRNRICWLIGVAGWLQVPLIVTAEDIAREGGVDPQVARALPVGVQVVGAPRADAQVLAGAKVLEDILGLRGTTPIDPKVKK